MRSIGWFFIVFGVVYFFSANMAQALVVHIQSKRFQTECFGCPGSTSTDIEDGIYSEEDISLLIPNSWNLTPHESLITFEPEILWDLELALHGY